MPNIDETEYDEVLYLDKQRPPKEASFRNLQTICKQIKLNMFHIRSSYMGSQRTNICLSKFKRYPVGTKFELFNGRFKAIA